MTELVRFDMGLAEWRHAKIHKGAFEGGAAESANGSESFDGPAGWGCMHIFGQEHVAFLEEFEIGGILGEKLRAGRSAEECVV